MSSMSTAAVGFFNCILRRSHFKLEIYILTSALRDPSKDFGSMSLVKRLGCLEISECLVVWSIQWYHWLHDNMLGNLMCDTYLKKNDENVALFLCRNILDV